MSGPLSNDGKFFIIADSLLENIYQVDATTRVTGQLLPFGIAREPSSVAYDPTDNLVYWADRSTHTINRYSLLTNNSTVIYRDPSNAGKDTEQSSAYRYCNLFTVSRIPFGGMCTPISRHIYIGRMSV